MVKTYLAAYNLIAFGFWAAFLAGYILSGLHMNPLNLLLLNIAQGMALLEIVHALLKWVKSPVGSTVAQVASRIMVLVFINLYIHQYPDVFLFKTGVVIVSLAWGVTELVRYSFYLLGLYNRQPYFLLWMRYSFFIVLYPLGVTGEWFILATPIAAEGLRLSLHTGFLAVVLAAYLYYFPVLYGYMWKQRKLKLVADQK